MMREYQVRFSERLGLKYPCLLDNGKEQVKWWTLFRHRSLLSTQIYSHAL